MRVRIHDYLTSDVRGIRLYRVDDGTGELAAAGRIEFLAIVDRTNGEQLKYTQFDADGDPSFGPIYTPLIRDPAEPAAIEVNVALLNQLPAGWFKVASYNLIGTSNPSTGRAFLTGREG